MAVFFIFNIILIPAFDIYHIHTINRFLTQSAYDLYIVKCLRIILRITPPLVLEYESCLAARCRIKEQHIMKYPIDCIIVGIYSLYPNSLAEILA